MSDTKSKKQWHLMPFYLYNDKTSMCCVLGCFSCVRLFVTLPVSSVHGILQARFLEWVVISSSRGSSPSRDWTPVSCFSCIGRGILYHWCHLGRKSTGMGCHFPSPGDLPDPGIKPRSPAFGADALTSEPPEKQWIKRMSGGCKDLIRPTPIIYILR